MLVLDGHVLVEQRGIVGEKVLHELVVDAGRGESDLRLPPAIGACTANRRPHHHQFRLPLRGYEPQGWWCPQLSAPHRPSR